tara:strand:- start:263 stop:418 length:156 start_codon:yes stop_codon:yes gene_type:complete
VNMSELNLEKKIENLKNQQEQAKELFIKCEGAIEILQNLLKEELSSKKDEK